VQIKNEDDSQELQRSRFYRVAQCHRHTSLQLLRPLIYSRHIFAWLKRLREALPSLVFLEKNCHLLLIDYSLHALYSRSVYATNYCFNDPQKRHSQGKVIMDLTKVYFFEIL
jgi:hypothetical protein